MIVIKVLYTIAALLLALYGFQAIILSVIYLWHRRERPDLPSIEAWPSVTIQLPIFNELYVVEGLLDAVTRIRYPKEKLQIQVLDDSTDETTQVLKRIVAGYRKAGIPIELVRRPERGGYKAGALSAAMDHATGEIIAIFDADFLPPDDFLMRTVPHFSSDERLGLIQSRWGHTNADYSVLTRAQALALDGHFIVEQGGRHRGNLFMSFNGTAGIWRRQCIEEAGGWSADTLCEDLDLSYRAQLAGWRCLFLPHAETPAEIPAQMAALKRQQARWAQGSIQCLFKLWRPLLTSDKSLATRVMGLLHLSAYSAYPLSFTLLLCSLPLLISEGRFEMPLAWLGLAGFGLPLMYAVGQRELYRDWPRRLLAFPPLMLIGAGLAWGNTLGVLKAITGRQMPFSRTPKFQLRRGSAVGWEHNRYALSFDGSNIGELLMMLYTGVAIAVAVVKHNTYVLPFLVLYLLGFAFVASYDALYRARRALLRRRRARLSAADPVPGTSTDGRRGQPSTRSAK